MAADLKLPPPIPRRNKTTKPNNKKHLRYSTADCSSKSHDYNLSESVSLSEFVQQYSDQLPLTVLVQTGYFGETSRVTLSTFDQLNIHFIKHTNVVNARVSSKTFSIPTNSALEFSLVYNPNNELDEALKGFNFRTVADLLKTKIQPKVVCCMKAWKGENCSIKDSEILIIKGKAGSQISEQESVIVYSVTSSMEKILPFDCDGHFTTHQKFIHLFLPEYILYVPNLFPCEVVIHLQKSNMWKHFEEMPQDFITSVITLTKLSTETTLLTTSAITETSSEIIEIPIDIPEVKVSVLEFSDSQQAQKLYERSCNLLKTYNPKLVQCMIDAKTEEEYTIQSKLYSGIQDGHEIDGIKSCEDYEYIQLDPRNSKTLQQQSKKQVPPIPQRHSLPALPTISNPPLVTYDSNTCSVPYYNTENSESESVSVKKQSALKLQELQEENGQKLKDMQLVVLNMQKKVDQIDFLEDQLKQLGMKLKRLQEAVGIEDTELEDENVIAEKNRRYLSRLTSSQVTDLLVAMDLGQYAETFSKEKVDGAVLVELDDEILQTDLKMNIRIHRIRLLKVITGRQSTKRVLQGI